MKNKVIMNTIISLISAKKLIRIKMSYFRDDTKKLLRCILGVRNFKN